MTCNDVSGLQRELNINSLYEEKRMLKAQLRSLQPFTEASMQDDGCVQFHTGMPNYSTLQTVLKSVAPKQFSDTAKLSIFQKSMMILLKLRLHLPMKDLAHCFQVSTVTVRNKWMVCMDC